MSSGAFDMKLGFESFRSIPSAIPRSRAISFPSRMRSAPASMRPARGTYTSVASTTAEAAGFGFRSEGMIVTDDARVSLVKYRSYDVIIRAVSSSVTICKVMSFDGGMEFSPRMFRTVSMIRWTNAIRFSVLSSIQSSSTFGNGDRTSIAPFRSVRCCQSSSVTNGM